jgi:hypothetical protein
VPHIVHTLAMAGISLVPAVTPGHTAASVPAPPVIAGPAAPSLVSWTVDGIACDDGAQPAFVRAPDPVPTLGYGYDARVPTLTAIFRIDVEGRPLGVARQGTEFVAGADDVLPALVAARFGGGAPHRACSVRFVSVRQPVATAAPELAMAYTLFPAYSPAPRAVWERTRPVGSTCFEPAAAPLLRAFPDFKAMPGESGLRGWSMVGFDLDANGRPLRPHVVAGTGFAPLDAASVKAVAASRFEKGARTGCLYPYYRNAQMLAPPPAPETESLKPAGATCPRDLPFVKAPVLTFPDNYRRRSIEGWAVMAYDVAPWGAIGNIRVLAAEPAAEFGEAGRRVLADATKPAGTTGYVGCVDKVVFRMGYARALAVESPPPIDY